MDAKGSIGDGEQDKRVRPDAPHEQPAGNDAAHVENLSQRHARVGRIGPLVLAAVSLLLIAVSIGLFVSGSGRFDAAESLLQTTTAESDAGSADAPADEDKVEGAGNNEDAGQTEGGTAASDGFAGEAGAAGAASGNAGASSSAHDGSSASAGGAGTSSPQPSAPAPAPANTVTVSVSVSSSSVGNPVAASGTYTFDEGATAYDALCALGLSVNASDSPMGIYVAAIGGLAEKEHGAKSGWMYSVNGTAPNYSAGSYELHDGDSVSWYYVTG